MCSCVSLAVIDLEMYNFGLYIVLLCIVGTMLACALCIANPQACTNPEWYTKFCLLLHVSHYNFLYHRLLFTSELLPHHIKKLKKEVSEKEFRDLREAHTNFCLPPPFWLPAGVDGYRSLKHAANAF
ncbi:unnamed protein product [Heligmosomoides polygyrus]|uniref:Protein S-acyltransferase n=1 Tax=Heligmosomoides polygyrus TaxID=6339 RepID=A0A183GGM9_HELPZ|nr:unnamed protein product [Heligmosomoides polygyrus]